MTHEMKRLVVETVIPSKFKWVARDLDGSVHVFEKEPNLDYGTNKNPVACDMWLGLRPLTPDRSVSRFAAGSG